MKLTFTHAGTARTLAKHPAIAKSLKLDHQKIIQLNPGVDFTKLSIGQQIRVPQKP
jgi:LysM repeat protein